MFNQKANKKDSKINPALMSLGGPNAVRKSNFKPAGVAKIDLKSLTFKLSKLSLYAKMDEDLSEQRKSRLLGSRRRLRRSGLVSRKPKIRQNRIKINDVSAT